MATLLTSALLEGADASPAYTKTISERAFTQLDDPLKALRAGSKIEGMFKGVDVRWTHNEKESSYTISITPPAEQVDTYKPIFQAFDKCIEAAGPHEASFREESHLTAIKKAFREVHSNLVGENGPYRYPHNRPDNLLPLRVLAEITSLTDSQMYSLQPLNTREDGRPKFSKIFVDTISLTDSRNAVVIYPNISDSTLMTDIPYYTPDFGAYEASLLSGSIKAKYPKAEVSVVDLPHTAKQR